MRKRKTGRRHDDGRRQGELFPPSPVQGGGAEPGGKERESLSKGAGGAFTTVMPIDGLDLPAEALGLLRESYEGLSEMQADSVRAGLLEGQSVLVSAPTSGGKTLVALLAILACLSRGAGRAVYLCPARSLATEKHRELQKLESIELNGKRPRVAVTMGDYGADDRTLEGADVVVMTNERLDVLMRRSAEWRERLGLLVVDEVHVVGDEDRGAVLETVVAHALNAQRPPQVVGLSATAPNAEELAGWLGATTVQSCERPVPLFEGTYDGDTLRMPKGAEALRIEKVTKYKSAVRAGIASALKGKTILFAGTRPSAVSMAVSAADALKGSVQREEREKLAMCSARIRRGSQLTGTVKKLIELIGCGVAFHHAGLDQNCKEAVEGEFRNGAIRLVVCTPTLAVGVNLPARRVIIASLSRPHGRPWDKLISVREYRQMAGRAGRPGHDRQGDAIIVTKHEKEQLMRKRYMKGEPEAVRSRIAGAESMRTHLLSLVVIYPGIAERGVRGFFLKTLARRQVGEDQITQAVESELGFLRKSGFVRLEDAGGQGAYFPTAMGRRVTELYLAPSVALQLIKVAKMDISGAPNTLGLIHAALTYGRVRNYPVREVGREPLDRLLDSHLDEMFQLIGGSSENAGKATAALLCWIDESSEVHIADTFDVESGELREARERTAGMIHCIAEISRLVENAALAVEADALATRMRHGIRAELLDLVKLRGVGRVHARKLYRAGYANRESMLSLSAKRLNQITSMGIGAADKVLDQVRALYG